MNSFPAESQSMRFSILMKNYVLSLMKDDYYEIEVDIKDNWNELTSCHLRVFDVFSGLVNSFSLYYFEMNDDNLQNFSSYFLSTFF